MATPIELSPKLKAFFITAFDNAVENTIADGKLSLDSDKYRSPDIVSIAEHLEDVLNSRKEELDGKDRLVFNCFLTSLKQMIRHRHLTMGFTSFVSIVTDFIRYICIWLNNEKGYNLDIKVVSRRKALLSELKKILLKSLENVNNPELMLTPPVIRDRFGLRLLLAENNPELLLEVIRIMVSILTNPESDDYIEFTQWLKTINCKFGGEEVPRALLVGFLSYHLDLSDVKNYILKPRESTYQSWQATLTVDATSPDFCGFKFELQARTSEMHKNAEYGSAAHDEYKKRIQEIVNGIFEIHNYSGGIVHYEGPEYPDLDMDGLSTAADILSRHISKHVAESSFNTSN